MVRAPSQHTRTSVLARPHDTLSPCPQKKWSPVTDSHRRIPVYKTGPVAAEATGQTKIRMPKPEGRKKSEIAILKNERQYSSGFGFRPFTLALPAGFPPASIRLEGGCLKCPSHESVWHAVPVLPRTRGGLEALLRCWRPAYNKVVAAAGFAPTRTGSEPGMLRLHHAAGSGIGGPEGIRTLISPADNGALLLLSYGSEKMVGSAGNAPVVVFQRCFSTAGLQTAGWITSPKM